MWHIVLFGGEGGITGPTALSPLCGSCCAPLALVIHRYAAHPCGATSLHDVVLRQHSMLAGRTQRGFSPTLHLKYKRPQKGPFVFGGEGGIRTHGTRERTTDFESVPFGQLRHLSVLLAQKVDLSLWAVVS